MEITIAWFWIIAVLAMTITVFASYKAIYVYRFKSNLWNTIAILLFIFYIVMPIKINVNTTQTQNMQNHQIEQNRIIPPRITDDSFKQNNNIKGIQSKDLQ